MMKKKLRVYFTDFWPVFNKNDNFFLSLLKNHYDIEVTDNNPDYIFYSVFGNEYRKFKAVRIFFTGENIRPDFNECDYAFTFDYIPGEKRHYRLPLYPFFDDVYKLLKKSSPEEILKEKTAFCNFIYSNPGPRKRAEFFQKLSKYKKVDSGGRYLNNIGGRVGNKTEFIRRYKFTFAFENESYPGYTTEKIFEPMLVNSIPIYWGNPLVFMDFNRNSFLNYHDYENDEALIERIIEIDKNDDLYLQILSEPWFEDNRVNCFVDYDNIRRQFGYIFSNEITPIAAKSSLFSKNPIVSSSAGMLHDTRYILRRTARKIKYFSPYKLKLKIDRIIKG